MVIFHSYVKLPEGTGYGSNFHGLFWLQNDLTAYTGRSHEVHDVWGNHPQLTSSQDISGCVNLLWSQMVPKWSPSGLILKKTSFLGPLRSYFWWFTCRLGFREWIENFSKNQYIYILYHTVFMVIYVYMVLEWFHVYVYICIYIYGLYNM